MRFYLAGIGRFIARDMLAQGVAPGNISPKELMAKGIKLPTSLNPTLLRHPGRGGLGQRDVESLVRGLYDSALRDALQRCRAAAVRPAWSGKNVRAMGPVSSPLMPLNSYSLSNPVIYVDPSGQFVVLLVIVGVGAITYWITKSLTITLAVVVLSIIVEVASLMIEYIGKLAADKTVRITVEYLVKMELETTRRRSGTVDITRFAAGHLRGQNVVSEIEGKAEEDGVNIDGNVRFHALWMCKADDSVVWVPVARIKGAGTKNGESASYRRTVYGKEVKTDLCCPQQR